MKRINKKTRAGIIASLSIFSILTVIGITTFLTKNANAETSVDPNPIAYKILLNEMKDCFAEPYMYTSISVGDTGNGQGHNQYISFARSVLKNKKAAFEEDGSGKKLLPTKTLTLDEKWKSVDCTGLFIGGDGDGSFGNDDFGGVLGISGKKIPTSASNNQEIGGFLKSFGYSNVSEIENVGNNAGETCHNLSYELKPFANGATTKTGEIVTLCWSNELLQNVSDGYALVQELDDGSTSIDAKSNGLLEFNSVLADPNGVYVLLNFKGKGTDYMDENNMPFDDITASTDYIMKQNGKPTYSNSQGIGFRDSFYGILYKNYEQYGQISLMDNVTEKSTNSTATKQLKYKISPEGEIHNGVYPTAYGVARNFLGGGSSRQEITEAEKLVLYQYYLTNVFIVQYEEKECLANKPIKYTDGEHYYSPVAGKGWCRTTWNSSVSEKKVAVFGEKENYELTELVGIETLFERIAGLNLEDEEIKKITEEIEKKEYDDRVEEASKMDPCFSKANSVGWILCPVIEILSDTTENLYTWIEDDFLSIEAGFFTGRDQTSLYGAWSGFVGIANIILVVFFLIIVFSQLTGVGIDNYGIKKTLPKIIVAAILINLSYYICELAVDVSNILGRALNDWFTAMGQGLPMIDLNASDEVNTHAGLFSALKSLISGGIIATTAVTAVTAFQSGGFVAILLPLLAALVIALVAIFFFFILLGLRKAGVIILIAISPLAFVCYMLPNTKPLFSKWVKALKGLLILYPICGLLIGGGFYVSRMLMSLSSDYFMRFIAMMLTVVPFFFIPKLLTSSFAAMGNIGAKITSLGRGLGRRTSSSLDKGIRGTNRFKARQNDWDMRNNYRLGQAKTRRANATIDALTKKQKSGAELNAAERMRLAQANQIRQGERDMQTKAYESQFSNYGKPEMQDELIKAFGGNDENEMMAAINTAENGKMDEQLLNALYKSDLRGRDDILQRLARSSNNVVSAYAKEQLKRGASERKSFSDFVNNNTDVKSDTNSLHAYQQGKGSNWVTGMNDDTLKFINSKNQHAFEANALLNAASQTQNLKELNPLNDMIGAAGITDPSMITGKMLEGMDESTAKVIGGALLQDAWADIVKGNREANVSGAVRDVINSARTASSRPQVDPRRGSSGMDESGF